MLKVNEEKLLLDHKELVDKRETNLAAIEKQATLYAIERGYNEEKTAQFVAFTKELEGDGLSVEEKAKLEILNSYIDVIEDTEEKPTSDEKDAGTETSTESVQLSAFGII